ncbi:hypothetical protein N7520_002638 [Penicillium odoratum]|uniref:uncharacterized protein n=1 Tax=Penicillium odoratum TaxID=1167516 RepID=UPI00254748B9|nr:uncharacterized protein N7520_002638 [Penicillium odoratum]KAJ5772109.1 hypothetical protein N7520_002638 [Penicillium odoratum]
MGAETPLGGPKTPLGRLVLAKDWKRCRVMSLPERPEHALILIFSLPGYMWTHKIRRDESAGVIMFE